MDERRIDRWARHIGGQMSRRAATGIGAGGLLAVLLGRPARAVAIGDDLAADAQCLANGKRCGRRYPPCRRCCSGYVTRRDDGRRPRRRQRRCSCVPAGKRCQRHDQCCLGRCDAPAPGLQRISLQGGPPESFPGQSVLVPFGNTLFVSPPASTPPPVSLCAAVTLSRLVPGHCFVIEQRDMPVLILDGSDPHIRLPARSTGFSNECEDTTAIVEFRWVSTEGCLPAS